MALGVTLSTPDDDQVSYTLEDLLSKLKVAVGGRVAEELIYGTITTAAESDIQQLTQVARHVTDLLTMHREQLDALASALLEAETLDGIDAYRAAGLPMNSAMARHR